MSGSGPRPISGVIFDLDDTLFDCTGLLTVPARERAASILAPHTDISEDGLTALQTELVHEMGSSDAIRTIGQQFSLPPEIIAQALAAYNRDDVPEIAPHYQAADAVLPAAPTGRILQPGVTRQSGCRCLCVRRV